MAKVLGPLHSDHVKGSISGSTFSEYRGLAVVKRKLRPVNRAVTVQASNRAILSWLSRAWGDELLEDRLLWDVWAQNHPVPNGFGGTFQLKGNQAYIALNSVAVRLGGEAAKQSQPPIADMNQVIDTLTLLTGSGIGTLTAQWTVFGTGSADDFVEVSYCGPFQSAGRMAVAEKFKVYDAVAGTVVEKTLVGLQPGAWYWVAVRYIDKFGQVSVRQTGMLQSEI
jgi:hypothetical protein